MAILQLPGRSILDMDTRKIEGVADGTADGDAVNYGQVKHLNNVTLHEGTDNTNDTLFQHYYLSTDAGATAVGTPVPVGADEIVAETIQRNAANQTLEQWIAAGNTADNFVPVPANSLTYISLARDEALLSNANETKMEVATENGNNYHYDLLRFVQLNGRLVLQTDNLVKRLEESGGIYPRAASGADTDFTQPFTLRHGSTWYFENNIWLYEGGLYGDGGLEILDDSMTFLNRPQHSASTADWIRLHSIEWSQHIAYFEGDIVTYTTGAAGSTTTTFYRAKQSITGASNNANPATDTTTWAEFNVGGFEDGTVVRLGAGSTIGASGSASAIQTALPSLGPGSMVFDNRASTSNPIQWQAFKPLMTGLDSATGLPDERNFAIETSQEEYGRHVTSQNYQTNQFGQRSQVASLQAQVTQIEEELSHGSGSGYTWVDEAIFETVFVTNRTNSSGTTDQTTILQPHFVDTTHVFTTYAVLTGTADSGLRNEWNGFTAPGVDVVVGLGPDDANLIAFQLVSSYYRDSTAAGLVELKLRMVEPDTVFPGSSSTETGVTTNQGQFISWISGNDNPITTADPNPIVHQGISTYYYETDNDFLDTVRHSLGSHIEGSSLTPAERVIVDNLVVGTYTGNLDVTGDLGVTGAINDGNSNAMAYVAIQFTSIFTEIRTSILDGGLTSPDVPGNYTYIEYTAEFGSGTNNRVTMIDRVASTGATITRRFTTATPSDFNTGTEVLQS